MCHGRSKIENSEKQKLRSSAASKSLVIGDVFRRLRACDIQLSSGNVPDLRVQYDHHLRKTFLTMSDGRLGDIWWPHTARYMA